MSADVALTRGGGYGDVDYNGPQRRLFRPLRAGPVQHLYMEVSNMNASRLRKQELAKYDGCCLLGCDVLCFTAHTYRPLLSWLSLAHDWLFF